MKSDAALDILEALGRLEVTVDLLKETKVGVVVSNAKKVFANVQNVSEEAKKIIAAWRAIYESSKTETSKTTTTEQQNEQLVGEKDLSASSNVSTKSKADESSVSKEATKEIAEDPEDEDLAMLISKLPETRKRVRQ